MEDKSGGNMEIDFNKIEHIYGKSIIDSIYDMQDEVLQNVKYFYKLGFDSAEDIFEREVLVFICGHDEFKKKLDTLINKLGANYVEQIEEDVSLLDELI